MGGLDARHMIALPPAAEGGVGVGVGVRVASLTTVSSPHRGSALADWALRPAWRRRLLRGAAPAVAQLTPRRMEAFNARVRDDPRVRYFSYGADAGAPPLLSPFRLAAGVLARAEGPNDGLVSVASSRWGEYRGTLEGVNHLDLINWPNRVRWAVGRWTGAGGTGFNAVAFYLAVADMLAREGL
ncbi:hypothetical protein UVI_02041710 [Ustilaginoidea virens]|nr:hypothetical protein UVI_02041710 [Ustilaginoidea virens]